MMKKPLTAAEALNSYERPIDLTKTYTKEPVKAAPVPQNEAPKDNQDSLSIDIDELGEQMEQMSQFMAQTQTQKAQAHGS